MKVVILAGGLGSRLQEETVVRPKPMVEIGGKPMLWHIMNIYAAYGFEEFLLALGYKSEFIKDYFLNFYTLNNDLTVELASGKHTVHERSHPQWRIQMVDTGAETLTGGRIKRLQSWIGNQTFMLTYGDAVADINIRELLRFHQSHGRIATVTAVRPPSRFGTLIFEKDQVMRVEEKSQAGEVWVNGGFFVLEPSIFQYIEDDTTIWERSPMERLASDGELMAFKHEGFWQPMDTLREKQILESLWASEKAPWKAW